MWLNYLIYYKFSKLSLFKVFVIAAVLSVTAQNKHTKNILMDFDYLVSQLYVQHCTFVEIGEGVCSVFIELPLEPLSCRKRSSPRQLYFGNCLCSEFRSWQLCSHQLAQTRPDDCAFEEGTDCPTSSARVHRRLCDVTGMSQWNPQCNCSVPLAGQLQEPLCGFRTCYSNPMPASICTPRTVCGTARCDVSLHGAVYGVKCDRKCKDRQSFCERTGPATSLRRPVTSEWSEWKLLNCDDRSSSIQQHEAECLDPENKPAFDCIGPGMFCCGKDDVDCICEVKQEEGHLKAYRYTITFSSSTEPDHAAVQVRSAVGFKGQAKVWNRILNMGSKDDDSESLFSNLKERKPQKTIKLQKTPGVQYNLKGLMKEDLENLLGSGVSIENSNISIVQGVYDKGKVDDNVIPSVSEAQPDKAPLLKPLNYTVSGTNNATSDQIKNIPDNVITDVQINKYDSDYHYTPVVNKGMEKSATLPSSGKSNKKQFDKNTDVEDMEKDKFDKNEDGEMDKLKSKTNEDSEKENILKKENSVADDIEKIDNPNKESQNSKMSHSNLKMVDTQVKQHTSRFYEGEKAKDGSESQNPVPNAQNENVSQTQSMNKTTGNLQANLTSKDKQITQQTTNEKSIVDSNKIKVGPSKEITNILNQPKEQIKNNNVTKAKEPSSQQQKILHHEPVKQENTKMNIVETAKNRTNSNLKEKSTPDIANLLQNNSSQENSGVPSTNTNVSKSNEIEVNTPHTTTFNLSGIIVKNKVEPDQTLDSTTQSTTFNVSGIIVKNKLQTTLTPAVKTDRKSNIQSSKDILSNYKELEALSKLKKEEEKKAHTSFYDEPEPVLKDLDKDSVDDNMADVLNNLLGSKNDWVEKKVETSEKKNNSEEKSNLIQEKAEIRKSKSENVGNLSSKMKKRKFHQG